MQPTEKNFARESDFAGDKTRYTAHPVPHGRARPPFFNVQKSGNGRCRPSGGRNVSFPAGKLRSSYHWSGGWLSEQPR